MAESTSISHRSIYYLPGRGGQLDGPLGMELVRRGYYLLGREITNREGSPNRFFCELAFTDQVKVIANDLQNYAWSPGSFILANSFGAYALLHAVLKLQKCPAKILLLSPVLGSVRSDGLYFKPPKARLFEQSLQDQMFPQMNISIVTGSNDNQVSIPSCQALIACSGGKLTVLAEQGHRLEPCLVQPILDEWLPNRNRAA